MKNYIMLFVLVWAFLPGNVSAQFFTSHNIQYHHRVDAPPQKHYYKNGMHVGHYKSGLTWREKKQLFNLYREFDFTREKALRDGRISYREARKLNALERKIQKVTRGNKKCRR